MARSGFKMKSGDSPLRQGEDGTSNTVRKKTLKSEISRFFSDLHTDLKTASGKHDTWKDKRLKKVADKAAASPDGLTNFQRRMADKKAQRESGGKSKYQRDIIKGQADRKAAKTVKVDKPYDIKSSSIFEPTKFGHEGKKLFGPTTTDLDRKMIMNDMKNPKITMPKSDKKSKGLYKGKDYRLDTDESTEELDPDMQREVEAYNKLMAEESALQKKSPTNKKSGFKMKSSPAKIYSKPKGKRTEY